MFALIENYIQNKKYIKQIIKDKQIFSVKSIKNIAAKLLGFFTGNEFIAAFLLLIVYFLSVHFLWNSPKLLKVSLLAMDVLLASYLYTVRHRLAMFLFLLLLLANAKAVHQSNNPEPSYASDGLKDGIYITVLLFLQLFLFTPAIIYFRAPLDLGSIALFPIIFYTIASIVLFVPLSIVINKFLQKLKPHYKNFVISLIIFIIVVNFVYGYIYQLELGIIRGLRFVGEKTLLQYPQWQMGLELLLLFGAFIGIVIYGKFIYKFIRVVSICIFFILTAILLHLLVENHDEIKISLSSPKSAKAISEQRELFSRYRDEYSFSKEKNILVLVFDAFSSRALKVLLVEKPQLTKDLEGFVWYKNTVSTGNFTRNSINAMIGGPEYTLSKINERGGADTTLKELLNQNWANLFNAIGNRGFSLAGRSAFYVPSSIAPYGSPLNNYKKEDYRFLFELALFKLSPVHLKYQVYNNGKWSLSSSSSVKNLVKDPYGHYGKYILLNHLVQKLNYDSPIPTLIPTSNADTMQKRSILLA